MIRKRIVNAGRKTAAVLLVLALSAGLFGCGGKDASKKDSTEESAAASSTVMEPINPEEVKSEDIIKEEEKPAESATQKDVIEKPDYFNERIDYYRYQYSTKAKAWEHEQEVRLLLIEPSQIFTPMALPYEPKEDEITDWKEVRAYPKIGGECFDSLYLGIKIDEEKKSEIIKAALTLNPDIKIYQMEIDPKAFRLKEKQI